MTFWIRWENAGGGEGPRLGPLDHRREAGAALLNQVRAAADALEHGTGKAGVWSWDTARQVATLYRDDLPDETPLGRYVVAEDTA